MPEKRNKLKVLKSQVPAMYIQECVINKHSRASLARALGVSPARLTQILDELKPQLDFELQKYKGGNMDIKTSAELNGLYTAFRARLDQALAEGDDGVILAYSKPIIDILKIKGLMDRVGLGGNTYNFNINNMTVEQAAIFLKPHLQVFATIIVRYVANKDKSRAIREIDDYLKGIMIRPDVGAPGGPQEPQRLDLKGLEDKGVKVIDVQPGPGPKEKKEGGKGKGEDKKGEGDGNKGRHPIFKEAKERTVPHVNLTRGKSTKEAPSPDDNSTK